MCRRQISFLIIGDEAGPSEAEKDSIRAYNARFGHERSLWDKIRDVPFLMSIFTDEIVNSFGRVLLGRLDVALTILAMIVYLLSPFDLVPEAVFGLIGLIDDVMCFLGGLFILANSFNQIL
mmetsp:Transcript_1242/g.1641  ORF Transcript_1242/g.1641 Transcript_1242/m.1641 type:complete len:121 (+) Transcript_1242:303-665(+)